MKILKFGEFLTEGKMILTDEQVEKNKKIYNLIVNNSYFTPDRRNDYNNLFFSTRKNGTYNQAGEKDIDEGYRIQKLLYSMFDGLDVEVRTSDEWTSLSVYQ